MTLFRFGYVAMSMHLYNASPSKTMTFSQFSKITDRDAAIAKLERIAATNLHNCLRLLRHNAVHDITFFRFSSKLIPLANHPQLQDWDYVSPLKEALSNVKQFLEEHPKTRVDFHPDHFVLLNTRDKQTFIMSLKTLEMHYRLLVGMGISPMHRCVLHVGGSNNNKEEALERFIHNWGLVPQHIQQMIILENDDTTFSVEDTLYICEKLGIPLVFDYHHFLANHTFDEVLREEWLRILHTWHNSDLPVKIHISSPKDDKHFRAHADLIEADMLWDFIEVAKGTVEQVDIMIEAKKKDEALFRLVEEIRKNKKVEWASAASFHLT